MVSGNAGELDLLTDEQGEAAEQGWLLDLGTEGVAFAGAEVGSTLRRRDGSEWCCHLQISLAPRSTAGNDEWRTRTGVFSTRVAAEAVDGKTDRSTVA